LVTEGSGHAIDPAGEARRALDAAVAQYGPQALSNPAIMDGICRDRLSQLPGEAVLIGSAARTDVPALLRARLAAEGTDGAIRSVASTLAEAHALDPAACLWVVREYARALGSGPQRPGGPQRLNRNALGIAAAVALVVIYLGVAAVAHLSPFPAKAAATTSAQGGAGSNGTGSNGASTNGASTSPAASPDPAPDPDPDPDPSPPSAYDTLLSMIPNGVQGNCRSGTISVGATAEADCTGLQGLAATTIKYYLFSGTGALQAGFTSFLNSVKFPASSQSCTTNNQFVSFVPQCKDSFSSTSPTMTGSVAEYVSTQNNPIIVSTDNQQLVMAVLIGTNNSDLLAYWKPLQWVQG
jgi:hypothetical protein